MQLGDEDGGLEADGAHAGAVIEVPQHALPVLAGAQEISVVCRPAEGLHLARVATQLARDTVGLDVEDDDDAIMLEGRQQAAANDIQTGGEGRIHGQRQAGRRGG